MAARASLNRTVCQRSGSSGCGPGMCPPGDNMRGIIMENVDHPREVRPRGRTRVCQASACVVLDAESVTAS